MNKLQIILFFYMVFVLNVLAEPTCSRSGTNVVLINGVLNNKTNAFDSHSDFVNLYKNINVVGSDIAKKLDSAGVVKTSYIYQRSEFSAETYDGILSIPLIIGAGLVDLNEVVQQFARDQISATESDYEVQRSVAANFFGAAVKNYTKKPIPSAFAKIIIEPAYDFISGDVVERDLVKMEAGISPMLKRNEKVILVSHSQGNFYANTLYERLFEDETQDPEVLNKKNIFGNLQVASPTAGVKAPHNERLLMTTDFINGTILNQESTHEFKDFSYLAQDVLSHGLVKIYLSDTLLAKEKDTNNEYRLMSDIFFEKLESISSKLYPNCCIDESGNYQDDEFIRHSYNVYRLNNGVRELAGFIDGEGGLVSTGASVSVDSELGQNSIVCSGVNINGYNVLGDNFIASGNVTIENLHASVSQESGKFLIHGTGVEGVKIIGNSFNFLGGEEFPIVVKQSPEIDSSTSEVVDQSNLEITGNVEITGVGELSGISGGDLLIKGDTKKTRIRFSDQYDLLIRSRIYAFGNSSIIDSEFYAADGAIDRYSISGKYKIKDSLIENSQVDGGQNQYEMSITNSTIRNNSFFSSFNIDEVIIDNSIVSNANATVINNQGFYDSIFNGEFYSSGASNSLIGDYVYFNSGFSESSFIGDRARITAGAIARNGSDIQEDAVLIDSLFDNSVALPGVTVSSSRVVDSTISADMSGQDCNDDICNPIVE